MPKNSEQLITRELLSRVRQIEIRTRRSVDHSVFKGRGMEFEEVREYVPGDDIRSIDWNVTARFGHPYIKKFVEERELTVMLLVDVSGSGDFGSVGRSKSEIAAELAALLAFSAIRNNDRVGLMMFSTRQELFVPPRKGRRHVLRLIRELLAHRRSERGTDIRAALESVMRLTPRRAVVFLISDMLDHDFEQTLAIADRRHDMILLRLTDPHELDLPKSGYVLAEDAETGQVAAVNSSNPRAVQMWRLEANGLRAAQTVSCRRTGVDLIDVICGEDYVKPLMHFFRAREKRR